MREIAITTIGIPSNTPEEAVFPIVASEADRGADLIILPEVWISQANREPGSIDDRSVRRIREIARSRRVNIVYPLDHRVDGKRRNSSLFISRQGDLIGRYDKIYPYWAELNLSEPVFPGESITVVEADFGRVGLLICFDVNFPHLWQELSDRNVDMVVWTSAYSAGSTLQAHALNHHYYIVAVTQHPDSTIIDITGKEIFHETGESVQVSRVTIDLDRCIFHENFNTEKLHHLVEEHPDEVQLEAWLSREQWIVLRSGRPDINLRKLAAQYGMEELAAYQARSRREIDRLRCVDAGDPDHYQTHTRNLL